MSYTKLFRILFKNLLRVILEVLASILSVFFKPERNQCFVIDDNILLYSAVKLGEKIKSGEFTSERVVQAYIKQIKSVDKSINAVVETHYDKALKRARQIDQALVARRKDANSAGHAEGSGDGAKNANTEESLIDLDLDHPFVGVPFSVKETIALAGASYTCGIASRSTYRASESNPAVDQLIRSGMIPIASTNTPCLNFFFDSYNLLHGRTNNPYDRSRVPGGSTGGEAALIASAGSVVGVGSDLAGSIRVPCNFCGIFGHKPTPLAVDRARSFPACRGDRAMMSAIGPMTRYACDLLPMLKLMITNEQCSKKMQLDEPVDLRKIRLFYCEDLEDPLSSTCDVDVLSNLRAAVGHLVSRYDIQATKVTLDGFRYGIALWASIAASGYVSAHEDPCGFPSFNYWYELVRCLFGTSMLPLNAIVMGIFEKLGSELGSSKQKYLMQKAQELRDEFNALLGDDGILVMPTHPHPAPHHHLTLFRVMNFSYTAVANALYAPITQCPIGMSREGLPVGVQLITTQHNDRLTLAVAQELERAFGGWMPPAKITTAIS